MSLPNCGILCPLLWRHCGWHVTLDQCWHVSISSSLLSLRISALTLLHLTLPPILEHYCTLCLNNQQQRANNTNIISLGQSTTHIQAATRRRTRSSICRSGPRQPAEETRVSLPSLLPRSRNSCSCTRYWIVTAHNLLSPFHSVCEKSSPGAKLITFCRSRAIRPGLVCQWRYRP